jgi:hypothetical protein
MALCGAQLIEIQSLQEIQVEPGPQDGTLLVTWQPVSRPPAGASGPVTGYAVYADGKKVTDVDSPTGDHALIDITKLVGINPQAVTVRTKSRDAQSGDSMATPIPRELLSFLFFFAFNVLHYLAVPSCFSSFFLYDRTDFSSFELFFLLLALFSSKVFSFLLLLDLVTRKFSLPNNLFQLFFNFPFLTTTHHAKNPQKHYVTHKNPSM